MKKLILLSSAMSLALCLGLSVATAEDFPMPPSDPQPKLWPKVSIQCSEGVSLKKVPGGWVIKDPTERTIKTPTNINLHAAWDDMISFAVDYGSASWEFYLYRFTGIDSCSTSDRDNVTFTKETRTYSRRLWQLVDKQSCTCKIEK